MEAVVECVLNDAPPPPELRMAWLCERWNSLPDPGGIHEQDYTLMSKMTAVLNITRAVTRIRELKGANIHHLTEHERKILRVLMDNGILFHA